MRSNPLYLFAFEIPRASFQAAGVGVVFDKIPLTYVSEDNGEVFGKTNVSATAVFRNILILNYGNVSISLRTSI